MSGRTWNDEGGPMVEPPPDEALTRTARTVLARLDAQARGVLEVQGRHVSDRLAREAADRSDRISASHAVSAAHRWGEWPRPLREVQRARATVDGRVDDRLLALYQHDDTWRNELARQDCDVEEQVQ